MKIEHIARELLTEVNEMFMSRAIKHYIETGGHRSIS